MKKQTLWNKVLTASGSAALVFTLTACGNQFENSTSDLSSATSVVSLHKAADEAIESVYTEAQKVEEEKSGEQLVEEYIARLETVLKDLKSVDSSSLPEELQEGHNNMLLHMEAKIEELKTDEDARAALLGAIEDIQARIADGSFEQEREVARQQMCTDLEQKLAKGEFPSEDLHQAVQAQYGRVCSGN